MSDTCPSCAALVKRNEELEHELACARASLVTQGDSYGRGITTLTNQVADRDARIEALTREATELRGHFERLKSEALFEDYINEHGLASLSAPAERDAATTGEAPSEAKRAIESVKALYLAVGRPDIVETLDRLLITPKAEVAITGEPRGWEIRNEDGDVWEVCVTQRDAQALAKRKNDDLEYAGMTVVPLYAHPAPQVAALTEERCPDDPDQCARCKTHPYCKMTHEQLRWACVTSSAQVATLGKQVADYDLLRRAVNESTNECLPGCSSYGHADGCPTDDPARWLADQQRVIEESRAQVASLAASLEAANRTIALVRRSEIRKDENGYWRLAAMPAVGFNSFDEAVRALPTGDAPR